MNTSKMRYRLSVAAAVALVLAASPAAAQLAAQPDRDNTLFEEISLTEGCSASTSNGAGRYLFSGFTNNGVERRALLHFDLSSIPPGSTVTSAALTLRLNKAAGASSPTDLFGLRRLTADWGEGTSDGGSAEGGGGPATPNDATWCERFYQVAEWTSLGGDFASPASATIAVGTVTPALHVWGSTAAMVADVQGWVDAPATNFGWILIQDLISPPPATLPAAPAGAVGTARRFDSREGIASVQPQLEVSFVAPSVIEIPTLAPRGLALLAGLVAAAAMVLLRRPSRAG